MVAETFVECRLATGIGVRMTGLWKRSPPGAKQKHELHVEELKILGETDASVSATQISPYIS